MYGCTDTPELLPVEQSAIGVSAQEIELVESELNAAYSLWESEEYDQAFIALERINHETMKTVWPNIAFRRCSVIFAARSAFWEGTMGNRAKEVYCW